MFRLTRFSVHYPTTVLMLVLGIALLGYISFQRLGVDLFPDLNQPRLFIEVAAGERPPEEMERQFVSQLEAATSRTRGVENVSSLSRTGNALITVEYGWQVDMDEAFLELQKSVADFSQRSGEAEITVSMRDPNAQPVIIATLSHAEIDDLDALRRTAENALRNELIRLPGVAAVEILGSRHSEIEILTNAYTLEAYGLSTGQLAAAVQNANRNSSGGAVVEMGRRYLIRAVGEFSNLAEIEELIVTYKTPPGQTDRVPVYLRELATVRRVLSESENIVRLNGRRCLGLEIFKEARFNTIKAAASIHSRVEELSRGLPGYKIDIIQDQSRFIETAIAEVEEAGLIGIFLAILVLFVFLRRLAITAVIAIAIPVSIVATFNLMYFNELTLNIMTLGGLALGAGMLVDNAIIVVENIFRHLENGESPSEAAIQGAGEVGGAITSSTLTTVIVFLPIVYLHGAASELFREQAWTVAFSLCSSLFVALLVIPMLCSRLFGARAASSQRTSFPRYAAFLTLLLRFRLWVILVGLLLVGGTVVLLPYVGSEFMPHTDQGGLSLQLTLDEGTSLERTEGAVRNVEHLISANFSSHIAYLYSRIGPTGSAEDDVENLIGDNNAVIHLRFAPETRLRASALIAALSAELADLPDIETQFLLEQSALQASLGTDQAPLVVEIKGDDLATLSSLANQVKAQLIALESLNNITTSIEAGRPEIDIQIDRNVAAQLSLSIDAIGNQLQSLLAGRAAGQLQYHGEYTTILIRRPKLTLDELSRVVLEAPGSRQVQLSEIARLLPVVSPRAIQRKNQTRIATVSAHLNTDQPFNLVTAKVKTALAQLSWPAAYNFTIAGEEKLRQEAFANLRFALILAVVLVYMVMAAQFESLLHPLVILLSIPLAGVGAVLLLLCMGLPFNVMSFIGIIMLAGIAVNDAIIFIDRINQNRRSGQPIDGAIIDAGQTRFRPILMTSLTTMLALLPLVVGLGEGVALRAPLAIAVIGGLCSSTALTLVVIPCLYRLLARFDRLQVQGRA